MKNEIAVLFITFCISIGTGCISVQPEVDDKYIFEKTPEQAKRLEKIENDIIAKKIEKDKAEETFKIAEFAIGVSKVGIEALEKMNSLKVKEQKLYEMKKDYNKAAEYKSKMDDYSKKLPAQKKKHDYDIVYRDNAQADLNVKIAEMAVLIASLNYEKAKIAVEIQKKKALIDNPKKVGVIKESEEKQPKEKDVGIDIKKFEEYLQTQQNTLNEEKAKRKETAEKLSKAEKALNESGYKGDEI